MERRQLYINGMTCINCQKRIENCLRKRVEIKEAEVSYETGMAEILYDADKITLKEIIRIINDLGYDAKSEANSRKDIALRAVQELAIILAVFFLLQHFGILNRLAPDSLADVARYLPYRNPSPAAFAVPHNQDSGGYGTVTFYTYRRNLPH